jgi:hypothetical protein
MDPTKNSELPETDVISDAKRPPVQLSAVPKVAFFSFKISKIFLI